jgi:3-deoxy-manno-octulosonate cytidylyltransferase (CMP-KDO synthetase)
MQSIRLPGKPLLKICGVPMIVRVLDRARACPELDRIIVATDSPEIARAVEGAGGEAWMTSPHHRTGSDRVAEVAAALDEELILNLQGDEPLLPRSTVTRLVEFAHSCAELTVATAVIPLRDEAELADPNIVKAIGGHAKQALYFSRYPVPYRKLQPLDLAAPNRGTLREGYYKHIGIYLYGREFLLRFVTLDPTPLEISESLEQLRILEHGYPVHLVEVIEDSLSVDTVEDLMQVETLVESEAAPREK